MGKWMDTRMRERRERDERGEREGWERGVRERERKRVRKRTTLLANFPVSDKRIMVFPFLEQPITEWSVDYNKTSRENLSREVQDWWDTIVWRVGWQDGGQTYLIRLNNAVEMCLIFDKLCLNWITCGNQTYVSPVIRFQLVLHITIATG